jgi:fumarylacetoacetate (FAA) hydrolase
MFSPKGRDLERGWPARIDGDRVIQLAAQTLQSFFTGGGQAREHAEYPLDEVDLLTPVLHPPSVRLFDGGDFAFANPAAIRGPEDEITSPTGHLVYELRPAAIVGAAGEIGGFTLMNLFAAPELVGAKARDFAIVLGPVVVTPEERAPRVTDLDWESVVEHAARNTRLMPGDVIAADPLTTGTADGVVQLEIEGIGVLRNRIGR